MNKKNTYISLILNSIIAVFVIFSEIATFVGWNFMTNSDEVLGFKMFQYYTLDSNILMGICAVIQVVFDLKLLKNKITTLPKIIYQIKLIGTVGVTLTFLVVIFFLWPTMKNIDLLFLDSNLFLHVLTPLLSIIVFIFFEKTDCLKLKETIIGISSMLAYAVFYLTNVFVHMENGTTSYEYDLYGFFFGKVINVVIVIPIIIIFTFGISYLLVYFNHLKINKNKQN